MYILIMYFLIIKKSRHTFFLSYFRILIKILSLRLYARTSQREMYNLCNNIIIIYQQTLINDKYFKY